MTRLLQRLRRDERGIALMVALAATLVLGIAVTAIITYTTANQRSTNLSQAEQTADQLAESALQQAYSILNYANATGANPSAATLLGCTVDSSDSTNSKSICSTATGLNFCITAASGCSSGSSGSATVWGCFTGTASGWCYENGGTKVDLGASGTGTWIIWATGYTRNPSAPGITSHTVKATATVKALDSGGVASVWNHVFVTSPLVAGQCQLNFGGNSTTINVPLYVVGNLCLPGNTGIQETAGGQAIDLQVGGVLYMQSGSHVGASSTSPITSGVVVGGCTTASVSATTYPCDGTSPSYSYWVKTKDTFVSQNAPAQSATDIQNDYNNFDPGPNHPCASFSPLATTALDNDTTFNDSAATFELTPNYDYSCVSQSGAGTGQLSWNNTTKVLTINGSIFIDGSMTMSQSATYTGTAIIEIAGSFTMPNNNTQLCAVAGSNGTCNFSNWQGSTSNRSMLTIASVQTSGTAFSFGGNKESFQGSIWTQPTAALSFGTNSVDLQGPISVGSFASGMNNTTIESLPVIKNMPVGAPIPPNTSAQVGTLTYTGT